MVRGELVDEAGGSALEWIGLIRAARNTQEQTLEAIADLPGGQVSLALSLDRGLRSGGMFFNSVGLL